MTGNDRSRLPDHAALLRQIDSFVDLDDAACEDIGRLIKWRELKKGVEIVSHEVENDEIYFIASGRVRVTIFTIQGKEISYQELGAGKMFGELSAIDRMPEPPTSSPSNLLKSESCRRRITGS